MRKHQVLLLLSVWLCWVVDTRAGIRPSFSLAYSAWHATHIVVVTEREKIDGEFTVLESWKGDLKKDDKISIPSLARFADEKSRTVEVWVRLGEDKPKIQVTGKRMILFLVKKGQRDNPTDNKDPEKAEVKDFPWASSALFGGMFVSVAWVEDGKLYGFVQEVNPGPSSLVDLNLTEEEAKKKADEIGDHKKKQGQAAAFAEPAKRAEALRPFATYGWVWSQQEAFKALEACGEDALPTLRAMLQDASLEGLRFGWTVQALAKVGGTKVGPDLLAYLEKDVDFWKQTGPKLDKGWWGNTILSDRYCRTHEVVNALRSLRYAPCRGKVVELRDFWRSLSQLENKNGTDQMSRECDAVLNALDQPER